MTVRQRDRVLITRSREGNTELAAKLAARGFVPVSVDTFELLPPETWAGVDPCLKRLAGFDWVALTSAAGVEFFASRMRDLSLPLRSRGFPLVAAVGEKTAAALKEHGVDVDFLPSSYLTKALCAELPTDRGKRVVVFRADIGDRGFVAGLRKRGFEVEDVAIYRTSPPRGGVKPLEQKFGAILFASPSAVEGFLNRLGTARPGGRLAETTVVCIGPVTAASARKAGFSRVIVAKTHTTEGMLECLSSSSNGGAS